MVVRYVCFAFTLVSVPSLVLATAPAADKGSELSRSKKHSFHQVSKCSRRQDRAYSYGQHETPQRVGIAMLQSTHAELITPTEPVQTDRQSHCKALRTMIETYDATSNSHVQAQLMQQTTNGTDLRFSLGNMDVTVALYHENADWGRALAQLGANVHLRPAEGLDESIAYVKHLLEDYDNLKELSVFLHGSCTKDWHSPKNLLAIVRSIDPEKLLGMGGYAGLNVDHYFDKHNAMGAQSALFQYRMDCLWHDDSWVRQLRERLNLSESGAFADWGAYCCGQFALHRDAARKWPRTFYKSLLWRLSEPQEYGHASYKAFGRQMEYLWHVIFAGTPMREREYTTANFTTNLPAEAMQNPTSDFDIRTFLNPLLAAKLGARILGGQWSVAR